VPVKKRITAKSSDIDRSLAEAKKISSAVGELCSVWSAIDLFLDRFITSLLNIKDKQIASALLNNIDSREKIKIVLSISYIRRLSDEWFETLKWCLDKIDGQLRAQRNRYVHDSWHVSNEGVRRIQNKTGFRKNKSKKLELYTEVINKASEKEILELIKEIQNMIFRLDILWEVGYVQQDWKKRLQELSLLPLR
jgi:hypothetical protein